MAGSPKRLIILAIVVYAILQILLATIYYHPESKGLAGDENHYLQKAQGVGEDSGWDLLWPPLYPQFLRFGLWLTNGHLIGVQILQAALLLALALFWGRVTAQITSDALAGALTTFLILTYPPLVAFTHYFWPEILHLFLLSIVFYIVLFKDQSERWAALLGLGLGLTLLSRSLLLGFVPCLLIFLARRGPVHQRVVRVGTAIICTSAVLLPIVVSHHREFGSAKISGSAAFNTWIGLNDQGKRSNEGTIVGRNLVIYKELPGTPDQKDQKMWMKSLDLVRRQGLLTTLKRQLSIQPFRLFDRHTYLTQQLPGGTIERWGREGYVGTPPGITKLLTHTSFAFYALILVAACFGGVYMGWKNVGARLWLLFILYNLSIFLILHVKSRYRIPMYLCLLPWAGYGLSMATRWSRSSLRENLLSTRTVLASVFALLLLFLGFSVP